MAAPLTVASEYETGDYVFLHAGDVCVHSEEALASDAPAPGNAQFVAASAKHGLVFFADTKGASRRGASDPCAARALTRAQTCSSRPLPQAFMASP